MEVLIIEIRSKTDSLEILKEKLRAYQNQGLCFGWLIDSLEENWRRSSSVLKL